MLHLQSCVYCLCLICVQMYLVYVVCMVTVDVGFVFID